MPVERAIGRMLIQAMIPEGLPVNTITRVLRRAGYSYRRSEMLSDIRRFSGRLKYQGVIEKIGSNEVVSRFNMVETTLKRGYKYHVFGQGRFYDPATNEYVTETRSFYTDELERKGDWERHFMESYRAGYGTGRPEIMEFHIQSVEHNEGYEY